MLAWAVLCIWDATQMEVDICQELKRNKVPKYYKWSLVKNFLMWHFAKMILIRLHYLWNMQLYQSYSFKMLLEDINILYHSLKFLDY